MLLAFHDDIYIVTPDPVRVGPIYAVLHEHLYARARIRINGDKTQMWNRGGTRLAACDVLEQIAQSLDPDARVWRDALDLPESARHEGVGESVGTPIFHRTVPAPEGPQTPHVVRQDPGTSRLAVRVVIALALCVSEGQLPSAGG